MNSTGTLDSDEAWNFLSDLVEEFCVQWESAPPVPQLQQFAQKLEGLDCPNFQRIGLIELIKVEFEFRANGNAPWQPLGSYLAQYPQLGTEAPPELVAEERRFSPNTAETLEKPELLRDFDPENQTLAMHRSREVHQLQPGDSIDDFDLLAKLGRGAFATVYLARQLSMQRLVALKVSADVGFEGATLAKLDHPNVVRVFDQRNVPEKSLRLMYMEYVAGGTLSDVIRLAQAEGRQPNSDLFLQALKQQLIDTGNSIPPDSANLAWIKDNSWSNVVARIGSQLMGAIAYTHQEGILHRDIKPANVLLDAQGFPKLVDFNISYGEQVVGVTAAEFFGGSLAYMSPEQMEAFLPQHERTAGSIDGSSDVYSLGITLFELLTGKRPFVDVEGPSPIEIAEHSLNAKQAGLEPAMKRELGKYNSILAGAIEKSLSPNRDERPDPKQLYTLLHWASDNEVAEYLEPPRESYWRTLVYRLPWLFIFAVVFGMSIFASWYVIVYNQEETFGESQQELFREARNLVNGMAYPTGLALLIALFWRIGRCLSSPSGSTGKQTLQAIRSNLNFGHHTALLMLAIWSFCGILLPIVLKAKGGELPIKAWIDFSTSHLIAGLVCAAFVFFGLTWLSLAAWHPRLVVRSAQENLNLDFGGQVSRIRSRVYWYRMIAIGAPVVAIAMLINFRSERTFSISCLSIALVIGLAVMARAIHGTQKALELIAKFRR